jgi:triosephosphate isomerase
MQLKSHRRPFALANWKMAGTLSQAREYALEIDASVGPLANRVEIVICPPYTALRALWRDLRDTDVAVGAQDLCAASDEARTGQISAPLLADAGCTWVMLGHWEVRRRTGETDADINEKVHAALEAGLRPIVLLGEGAAEKGSAEEALNSRLPVLLAHCRPPQIARMALVYEPEWTVGAREPAPPAYIAAACSAMRGGIRSAFGGGAAEEVRIIYGGSVTPENTERLLQSPDLDGLGAGRTGRDPAAFARIVRAIAKAKDAGRGAKPVF